MKFQSMDYGSTGGFHDTGIRRLGTFGTGVQDRPGKKPVDGLFYWEVFGGFDYGSTGHRQELRD